MNILVIGGTILITFCLMEMLTWCIHKYVMHGFLWNLHEDHHDPSHREVFEKNDFFFVFFAALSIIAFLLGTTYDHLALLMYIATGITLYGAAYFFVHDVFIHQRIKWFSRVDNFYFRALRKAHKVHHKHIDKEEGECFGMLYVPMKYFREAWKTRKRS